MLRHDRTLDGHAGLWWKRHPATFGLDSYGLLVWARPAEAAGSRMPRLACAVRFDMALGEIDGACSPRTSTPALSGRGRPRQRAG